MTAQEIKTFAGLVGMGWNSEQKTVKNGRGHTAEPYAPITGAKTTSAQEILEPFSQNITS